MPSTAVPAPRPPELTWPEMSRKRTRPTPATDEHDDPTGALDDEQAMGIARCRRPGTTGWLNTPIRCRPIRLVRAEPATARHLRASRIRHAATIAVAAIAVSAHPAVLVTTYRRTVTGSPSLPLQLEGWGAGGGVARIS